MFNLDGPDITEGPGEHLVREGGTIELICCENLDSSPEATVTWVSPQGKEIKASDEHYIMSKLPSVTLTIMNVTKSDHNGEWKCIVEVDGGDTYCPDPNKPQRTPNIHVHSIVVGALK